MKTNIIVNLQFEGIHCWLECPIDDVSFLKYPHRYIFHITCKKEVNHGNRDIEFIMLKREILKTLNNWYPKKDLGRMSCEELALRLITNFNLNYCCVMEDNENGAEIHE
jgi:hypothetical protein